MLAGNQIEGVMKVAFFNFVDSLRSWDFGASWVVTLFKSSYRTVGTQLYKFLVKQERANQVLISLLTKVGGAPFQLQITRVKHKETAFFPTKYT